MPGRGNQGTSRAQPRAYARALHKLSDIYFPKAKQIILVQDNLNTHNPASLYQTYPPDQARRLTERFQWHYTPKHGSWLNMAEIELNVLSSQCLSCRIADLAQLRLQTKAWADARNKASATIHWQFRNQDARIKLKHLYPKIM